MPLVYLPYTLTGCTRPYFGQAGWFILWHPEKLPSAIERYQKEILRVFGVLEGVLSKQEWLVGGKCTIADLSFIACAVFSSTSIAVTDVVAAGGTDPSPTVC